MNLSPSDDAYQKRNDVDGELYFLFWIESNNYYILKELFITKLKFFFF